VERLRGRADSVHNLARIVGLIGLGMAVSCLGTGLLATTGPGWLALPVAIAFGATASGWNGVFLAEVARLAPDGRVAEATGAAL